jgi:MFS transporter (putative signal transducer)
VDFTLFQCADAMTAAAGGLAAGIVAQHYGYGTSFGLATGLALAACIVVPWFVQAMQSTEPRAQHPAGDLQ